MKEVKVVEDGYEYDGGHYGGLEELIHIGFFGFCGCGMPWLSISLVGKVLKHIQVKTSEKAYKDWQEEGKKIASEEVLYFIYYWLDYKGYTDHGGSVPGWLTEDGEKLLHYIEEWEHENKEEE